MDAPDQFLIQSPPLPGVFAHVGHAIRDTARREHVPRRRIRRDELALQNQGRVLQGQRGSLDGVRIVGVAHQPVAVVIRQRHALDAVQGVQCAGTVLQRVDSSQAFDDSQLAFKAEQFLGQFLYALR